MSFPSLSYLAQLPLSAIACVGATVGCVLAPEEVRVNPPATVPAAVRVTVTVQVPLTANGPATQVLLATLNCPEATGGPPSVKTAPVVFVTVITLLVVVPKAPTCWVRVQVNNCTA